MEPLLALAALAVAACFVLFLLAVVGFVLKTVFWVVFFPIRLLLKLIGWVLGAGVAVLLLPFILLVAVVAIAGAILMAVLSILGPLLPVAVVALVGWAIYRASTRHPSPVI